MVVCTKCGKTGFKNNMFKFSPTTFMCINCHDDLEKMKQKRKIKERDDLIFDIACKLDEKGGFELIEAFLKKYPGIIPDKELIQLNDLIWEKYKVDIDKKDIDLIMDVLAWVKEAVSHRSDLKKFEEQLLPDKPDKQFNKLPKSTIQTKALYYSLKARGVDCEIEAFDGHKHVDISIPKAKLYIEIDGTQHSINSNQIMSDLYRDHFSSKTGYATKRLTNEVINNHLEEVSDAIAEVVKKRTDKEYKKNP